MSANVESIRYLWKQQIDKPFDVAELRRIKGEYDRQVKMDATHRKLYEYHRVAYFNDRDDARKNLEHDLVRLSKLQIANRCGFAHYSDAQLRRMTKEDMIGSYVFSTLSDTIKSDHDRVKDHWAQLTEAQKLGDEPFNV